MRKPLIVPETKPLLQMLEEFRSAPRPYGADSG